jgi:hypothetical protein
MVRIILNHRKKATKSFALRLMALRQRNTTGTVTPSVRAPHKFREF